MAIFEAHLSVDERVAELRFVRDDGTYVPMPMDARNLERFVANLALIRSRMKPAVPGSPPEGENMRLEHVQWRVGLDTASGKVGFQFRHPGLGWITLILDGTECAELNDALERGHGIAFQWSDLKH